MTKFICPDFLGLTLLYLCIFSRKVSVEVSVVLRFELWFGARFLYLNTGSAVYSVRTCTHTCSWMIIYTALLELWTFNSEDRSLCRTFVSTKFHYREQTIHRTKVPTNIYVMWAHLSLCIMLCCSGICLNVRIHKIKVSVLMLIGSDVCCFDFIDSCQDEPPVDNCCYFPLLGTVPVYSAHASFRFTNQVGLLNGLWNIFGIMHFL